MRSVGEVSVDSFFSEEKEPQIHTVIVIVANHHLLRLPVLAHFAPEVFIEGIKVILQLARVHLVLGVVGRVLVEVGQ